MTIGQTAPRRLSSLQTSIPLTSGRIQSSSSTSGSLALAISSPWLPLAASTTS
jgi:hypothetical protein